ncbi:FliH/SctL family protein [Bradymonas sediminis]|nr:FliH/SctL family protein [Bradymonas sediminis]TDP77556.1 type III secretion protein L [Bradymonas sediminis]
MSDEQTSWMPVLRASDVVAEKVRPLFREPGVRVIRRRVIEDLEQIDIAVNTARIQAEVIVKEAQQTASDIREAAHLEGRSEGLKEVLVELARARKVYANALDTAEKDMVELAFRLAARIIGDSVEREPERVAAMVAGVLQRARGKRDIIVMVSPEDLASLSAAGPALARSVDGVNIHFETDSSLTRGGCVIQTESGRIDGQIETQLDALQKALTGN